MRLRALLLLFLGLLVTGVLAACDAKGIPEAPTPTATAQPAAQATDTPAPVAQELTATPIPQPTSSQPQPTSSQPPAPTAAPAGTGTAGSAPTSGAATAQPQPAGTAEAQLKEVEKDEIAIRGLQPKQSVPETFINKQQMATNIAQQFQEDYSQAEAKRDAAWMWLMRLLDDRNTDLYKLEVDLNSEQVVGYYDPKKKDLFVLGSAQGQLAPDSRVTLAHEFTHAMQDQYFDIQKMRPEHTKDFDRDTAVTSLIEGDAVATELMFMTRYLTPLEIQQVLTQSNGSSQVFDSAPMYIRESLIFPYTTGREFVSALLSKGGYNAVNAAFRDPPTSTEQIIHPEKYMNAPRDTPVPVTLPPLTSTLGTGWTKTEGGTLGEFDFNILFKNNGISDQQAGQAAAGIGGAWFDLYQNGNDALIAIDSRWDTSNDASEFDSAYRDSLNSLTKDGDYWTSNGRYFAINTQADQKRVVLVTSTNRQAVDHALAAMK